MLIFQGTMNTEQSEWTTFFYRNSKIKIQLAYQGFLTTYATENWYVWNNATWKYHIKEYVLIKNTFLNYKSNN